MKRWHDERALMIKRMAFARWDHGKWQVCDCHRCVQDGIGWFRDRHPRDCGRRCYLCHWDKLVEPKARHNKKLAAIKFEFAASA